IICMCGRLEGILMGAVTSLLFSMRNTDKCVQGGETTRGVVAAEQVVSAADSIAGSSSSIFSTLTEGTASALECADGAVSTIFEKIGKSDVLDNIVETTGANTKIGAIAQKSINPLLCVAAGVRVLNDDDQYAALIEETSAMTTMFATESVMKYLRSATTGTSQATTGMAGKVAEVMESSSTIKNLTEKASNWYTKLGTSSNGSAKQTIARIGIDILFVAGSICAYNLGKKLGELISGRNKEET
ncbi:MAG: hypothetical protein LUE64_06650, partial [Candidatus Gastranaerophilales bacterium]|nr:hypothetical protein [Candidatus Gastranaerophilales bacterium]